MSTPNINEDAFKPIDVDALFPTERSTHPVKILLLYGSLRKNIIQPFGGRRGGADFGAFGRRGEVL